MASTATETAASRRPSAGAEQLRFTLGLKLRNLRRRAGYSLKEMAQRAGVSISYLSELEKGKKYPKPDKMLRLAEALKVSFDELVSQRVTEELSPLKEVFGSEFVSGFPFEFFGLETEDVFALMTHMPEKAGALIQTLLEVGRTYDLQVEHFLLAALRSYQQANANYFGELEERASAYRRQRGWAAGAGIDPGKLERELGESFGYVFDRETLPGHPELAGLRSVYREGSPPTLMINGRLMPSQEAFVLARELGYRHLDLGERAVTSSWLQIESFQQLLNNFKASYFAGALMIDQESLREDLAGLFAGERWDPSFVLRALERYNATPEMLLYRLTELAPTLFGLKELFFTRFLETGGSGRYELTKVFNLSDVPVPHGISLNEHYCRRWSAFDLLRDIASREDARPDRPSIAAQRARFLGAGTEFFVISLARPLVLSPSSSSSVSVGFLIDDRFKRKVRFWDDPAVPSREVNLTCERCGLADDACDERVAPPRLHRRRISQRSSEKALARLLAATD